MERVDQIKALIATVIGVGHMIVSGVRVVLHQGPDLDLGAPEVDQITNVLLIHRDQQIKRLEIPGGDLS